MNEVISENILSELKRDFPNVDFSFKPVMTVNCDNAVALAFEGFNLVLGPVEDLYKVLYPIQYNSLCVRITRELTTGQPEESGGNLIPRVVSIPLNRELLSKCPHTKVCEDLAVVYLMAFDSYTATISNKVLSVFGWDKESIHKKSFENLNPFLVNFDGFLYLSSEGPFGSAALFKNGVMEKIVKKMGGEDQFILLPSSPQSWTVLPTLGNKIEDLSEIVKQILSESNKLLEPHNEIVSEHPYRVTDGKLIPIL